MVNLNSAENAYFMVWTNQFQKICQIKAWYISQSKDVFDIRVLLFLQVFY